MLIEGQRLGDFEILDYIGQGGMGAVFKARQISLERIVAIKTLKPFLSDDADYVARFQQEAVAAAALNHPNLVQVYAAGKAEGIHFFAMEYIDGESAQGRLERKEVEGREGRIDPFEAIAIATHISVALDHGWRKAGLIHRDIKPDNIFLSTEGEVKLGDLGLAKSGGQSMATLSGAAIGTPTYISPEQAEGKRDIDLRADIYSLGCTLFHLLSGRPPYQAESSMAIMLKHVSAPVPDLREAWPECPGKLAALVSRMMRKAPADRFQTHAEVSAELRRVYDDLSGNSVPKAVAVAPDAANRRSGSQPGVSGVAKKKSKRMLFAGIAVGVLGLAVAFFVFQPKVLPPAGPSAPAEGRVPARSPSPLATSPGSDRRAGARPSDAMSAAPAAATAAPPTPAAAEAAPAAAAPPSPPAATPAAATDLAAAEMKAKPEEPAPPAPPAAPAPAEQPAAATPKPATEVEKWFALIDGPQQEAYHKQAVQPFEAGLAEMRARYLATLDTAIAKASAASQLAEALAWRTERQAFVEAQNVAADDTDLTPAVVAMRTAFRQQLLKLDQTRLAKAKPLFAAYDAILDKNQALLTQRQRLDDALLLKTKREAIASAWLTPSPLLPAAGTAAAESAKATPPPAVSKETVAALANPTIKNPFVNTLGMKFVPVPIPRGSGVSERVLFSIWDTRVQDYATYAKVNKVADSWTRMEYKGLAVSQEPEYPVVGVDWDEAQAFCKWLTEKEVAEGKLPSGMKYRLPTDEEWSRAVGLPAEQGTTPQEKDKLGSMVEFPWGRGFPPKTKVGNYPDTALRAQDSKADVLEGYTDGFVTTSPVGSFHANKLGLYDMGGNVWNWCEDWFDASQGGRAVRGSSWWNYLPITVRSACRKSFPPTTRHYQVGFRCVLSTAAPAASEHSSAPAK